MSEGGFGHFVVFAFQPLRGDEDLVEVGNGAWACLHQYSNLSFGGHKEIPQKVPQECWQSLCERWTRADESSLAPHTSRHARKSGVYSRVSSHFLRHFATVLYRTSRMEARITSASSSLLPPLTSTAAACRQTLLRCMSHYGCTRGLARLMESCGTILQEQE